MEIDVKEYLSDGEIKDIAVDVLRNEFHRQIRNEADIDRVLTNLGYEFVFKRMCETLSMSEGDVEEKVLEGMKKALDSVQHQVFRRADAWQRSESPAVKILDDVLAKCRPMIEKEVEKRIAGYNFRELEDEIEDTIYGVICRKLEGK